MPLNLPADAEVWLEGWLLGTARRGAEIELGWNGEDPALLRIRGEEKDGRLKAPDPPGPGRHLLSIRLHSTPNGAVVLDRVVVEPRE